MRRSEKHHSIAPPLHSLDAPAEQGARLGIAMPRSERFFHMGGAMSCSIFPVLARLTERINEEHT
jgi:hypothetical protein